MKTYFLKYVVPFLKRIIVIASIIFVTLFLVSFFSLASEQPRETLRTYAVGNIYSIQSLAEITYNAKGMSYEFTCEDSRINNSVNISLKYTMELRPDIIFSSSNDSSSDISTGVCHDSITDYATIVPMPEPWEPLYVFWTKPIYESYCIDSTGFRGYVQPDALKAGDLTCQ